MKYIVLFACLLGSAAVAHADEACSNYIAQQVASQAQTDFPNANLYVNAPDTSTAGSSVMEYDVTTTDNSNDRRRVFATYHVTINEVCQLVGAPVLKR